MDPGRSHSGPKWLVPRAFKASPAEFPGVTPCAQAGLGPHSCPWQSLGFVCKRRLRLRTAGDGGGEKASGVTASLYGGTLRPGGRGTCPRPRGAQRMTSADVRKVDFRVGRWVWPKAYRGHPSTEQVGARSRAGWGPAQLGWWG